MPGHGPRGLCFAAILLAGGSLANGAPLHDACLVGDEAEAGRLLAAGADVQARDAAGLTPLHYAAGHGPVSLVQLLLSKGAAVDAACPKGMTPLFFAAVLGASDAAALLLKSGAEVNSRASGFGHATPLHVVAWAGCAEMAETLVKHGADVNACLDNGETPLHAAASHAELSPEDWAALGAADALQLDHGPEGRLAVGLSLVAAGATIDARDAEGRSPLHKAIDSGSAAFAQMMIEKGADIDAQDADGWAPLHYAAGAGQKEVAAALLAKQARVDLAARNGRSPLQIAALCGAGEVADLLIEAGASLTAADARGMVAWQAAWATGYGFLGDDLAQRTREGDPDGSAQSGEVFCGPNATPVSIGGLSFVPEFVFPRLGAEVKSTLDGVELRRTGKGEPHSIRLSEGSRAAQSGSGTVTLPAAPLRLAGRLYVPCKAIATALGGSVDYDATNGILTVTLGERRTRLSLALEQPPEPYAYERWSAILLRHTPAGDDARRTGDLDSARRHYETALLAANEVFAQSTHLNPHWELMQLADDLGRALARSVAAGDNSELERVNERATALRQTLDESGPAAKVFAERSARAEDADKCAKLLLAKWLRS